MKNRIIAFIIICLILLSFSINVFSNSETNNIENVNNTNDTNSTNETLEQQAADVQSKINDTNTKLQYVQGELSDNLQKVEELDDSVTQYQSQYNDLQSQISDMQIKLNQTEAKLTDIQDVYNRKEKILKKRVVALYEAGDTSYIDLLLSSDSIVEFISNYFLVSELVEYDNELLDEISDSENQMKATQQRQQEQQNTLLSQKQQINQTKILLENTKILKQNYMTQLTEQETQLETQIAQYKQQQTEIENQIQATINNWTGTMSIQFTGGAMIWPIAMQGTFITSGFGNRLHPIQGVYKNHDGIDISGSNVFGAPVVAAADGVVIYASWMSGYGNCVMVNHGSGIVSLYGHGSEIVTQVGAVVKQGDVIMKVGSTGNSTGPHLHFEIRKDGTAVNPIPYLNGTIKELNSDTNNTINNITNIEDTNALDY